MPSINLYRKPTIFLCGVMVALITLFAPSEVRANGDKCVEPFLAHCLMNLENCLDCNSWCEAMFPEDDCVEEWTYCEPDEGECSGIYSVWEECSCTEGIPN
jgi:hypothetical protein